MSIQEIINQLTYFNEEFPKEQLKEAIKNRDEIIPLLLDGLDYVDKNAEEIFESGNGYFLHVYAMYLLAQFKEKKAFPKIINMLCKDDEVTDHLIGDILTGELDAILFSTYDGNLELLCKVIENISLNEYARAAAVKVYTMLYDEGIIKKEELIKYFKYLINDKLINDESYVMSEIAINIEEQHIHELIDDVRKMYDRNCIEIMTIGSYDDFIDEIFSYENQKEMKKSIEDAISEMSWWACFDKKENRKVFDKKAFDKMGGFVEKQMRKDREAEKKLLQNKKEKPQRNDPCPCGSGKKYKKCCLNKDQEESKNVVKKITIEDKYDLLGKYPSLIDDSNKEHLKLKDFYDDEAIDIDKLVYKALKHRQIPMWVKRDYEEEDLGRIEYLQEAHELFLNKCEKENIKSFEEYDRKHMIHYKSEYWLIKLEDLIIKYEKGYLNMIKETLSEFSN